MEELEALLADLEITATPPGGLRDPQNVPNVGDPPGTPPEPQRHSPERDPEQLYSSVRKPRPAPPPPALGELERLLRDLNVTQGGPADEILAQFPPPETPEGGGRAKEAPDEAEIGGSPPPRDSGTPLEPPKFGVTPPGPPKSAATQELDRLMASLADFHLQHPPPPKPGVPPGQDLEALLELLQAELRGRGVPTGSRGLCQGCQEPVMGQALRALGGLWHPEHFVCGSCGAELGSGGFVVQGGGVPLCPPCGPRCARCGQPVLGAVVTALGRTWHPEHFCCAQCGEPLGEEGFVERAGRPLCRRHPEHPWGRRCRGCRGPLLGAFAAALGGLWHPECFVCQECRTPFPGGSFFELGGVPLCQRHFQEGTHRVGEGSHRVGEGSQGVGEGSR